MRKYENRSQFKKSWNLAIMTAVFNEQVKLSDVADLYRKDYKKSKAYKKAKKLLQL